MKLVAINASEFGSLRWTAAKGYVRAAHDAVAALVMEEVSTAVLVMPVAFIPQEDEFTIVTVQALQPGKNLYVDKDGHWVAGYIPAAYRSYPFAVAKNAAGEPVLCFDEDSHLSSDKDGKLFYDADGELSAEVKEIAEFLGQVIQNRELTKTACHMLQQYNLVEPWPISFKKENIDQNVHGLYRINEQALRQLPAEALKALSDAGALKVAYLQLISTQHLPRLVELTIADAAAPGGKKSLDLDFLKEDKGTLDFSFL